jgi:hypothetical protein
VSFTEFERGWGQRPDGYILAASKEIARAVTKEYCERCNDPELYSRPNSEPQLIEVDELIHNQELEVEEGYKWFIA